jgi:pyrroloquinoline-quinone synthase
MDRTILERELSAAVAERRLIGHPFYRRWDRGELRPEEVRAYAAQYRHLEAALPGLLRSVAAGMDDGPAREAVLRTLADEVGPPVAHLELFETFARAVGAGNAEPSPATASLLAVQRRHTSAAPATGLAALAAYELQSSEVARTKAEGLRRHHGLDSAATRFWDVHADVDVEHAEWALEALASTAGAAQPVGVAAREVAEAWWAFLDERDATASQVGPVG